MYQRARYKLDIDDKVIQAGRFDNKSTAEEQEEFLRSILEADQDEDNEEAGDMNDDELNAVTSSDDFLDFVEKSSKVIERALDEEYDILADYELGGMNANDEEDDEYGNKRRGIKEITQFYDERWSKKRTISDLSFSPKV